MENLYSATLFAISKVGPAFITDIIASDSDETALGFAIQECRRRMPQQDGYFNHIADVFRIPDSFIRKACLDLHKKEHGSEIDEA